MSELSEAKTLNDGIDDLFQRHEITRKIVDALDAVRLRGNDAVHGGQIDPSGGDDVSVVLLLFRLVNDIVEATKGLALQTDALRGGQQRRPDPTP